MTKAERLVKARRALFELEEVVLDVLMEAKQAGKTQQEQALHPWQIRERTGLGGFPPPIYSTNSLSIIWGVLDSLVSEGRVEHLSFNLGAWLKDDLDAT